MIKGTRTDRETMEATATKRKSGMREEAVAQKPDELGENGEKAEKKRRLVERVHFPVEEAFIEELEELPDHSRKLPCRRLL
jgi:hypothetical protein